MANGCVNGTLDVADYSAPIPAIGLYVAGGTFVCVLFMLFDIVSAFRRWQAWMPCRFFTLNSLTLSLLTICTKLPVDLTTAMPGAQDQLSKLTATTLLCVAIGVMSPSIGNCSASDDSSNLVALSILIITVVVNICMQIATGVVQMFVVEHIITMFCMLVLLLFVWYSAIGEYSYSRLDEARKETAKEDTQNMWQRLKVFYIISFAVNPQIAKVKHGDNFAMSGCCFLSSAALVQATVRSLVLKQQFDICGGTSDYGWSMPLIVTTQIIMVILGCFALSIRYVGMFAQVFFPMKFWSPYNSNNSIFLGAPFCHKCGICLPYYAFHIIVSGVNAMRFIFNFPAAVYFNCIGHVNFRQEEDNPGPYFLEKYRLLCGTYEWVGVWITRKALTDIKRWVELSKSSPLTSLSQILQRTHPSEDLHSLLIWDLRYTAYKDMDVSSLSLVLLVRIATVALPLELTESLLKSAREVHELVRFIDAAVGSTDSQAASNRKLAEALALGDGFASCLPGIIQKSPYSKKSFQALPQLGRTLLILAHLKDTIDDSKLAHEVVKVIGIMNLRSGATVQEIYCRIEQSYVDMLHLILAHLPQAIHKEVMECPAEELEERARRSLRMICKFQILNTQSQWQFPQESRITSLMTDGSAEEDNRFDNQPFDATDDIKETKGEVLVQFDDSSSVTDVEANHIPFDHSPDATDIVLI